ncbi:MAG: LysR [Firmicutes bacterium]|nr:LysR [Bacillota bacterium]
MNATQILCFLEAAREKNFTRAAEKLYQTQPNISRTIALLEKELNTKLFVRLPNKRMELTECGRLFFETFEKCYNEFQVVKEKCEKIQNHSTLNLRLGYAIGWSVSKFLPGILNTLRTSHPYLNISVECYEFEDLAKLLCENRLDIIITLKNGLLDFYNLDYNELCTLPKVILFSKKALKIPKELLTPDYFISETFYIYESKICSDIKNAVLAFGKYCGFSPKIKVVPNMETMVSMVENEQGVAIMDLWSQPVYMEQFDYLKLDEIHTIAFAYQRNCKSFEIIQNIYQELIAQKNLLSNYKFNT